MNKTKVTTRGQTVIPHLIRKIYQIREGSEVEWIPQDKETILVRKARRSKSPDWETWVKALQGLPSDVWRGVDPVTYTRALRDDRR